MARAHRLVKNVYANPLTHNQFAHANSTSYIPFIRFLNNAQRQRVSNQAHIHTHIRRIVKGTRPKVDK